MSTISKIEERRALLARLATFEFHLGRVMGGCMAIVSGWEDKCDMARRAYHCIRRSLSWRELTTDLDFSGKPASLLDRDMLLWFTDVAESRNEEDYFRAAHAGFTLLDTGAAHLLTLVHAIADEQIVNQTRSARDEYAIELSSAAFSQKQCELPFRPCWFDHSNTEQSDPFPVDPGRVLISVRDRRFRLLGASAPELDRQFRDRYEAMLWFLHAVANTEMHAAEICGRNLIEFGELPWEYYADFSRQAWEETRHARMFMTEVENRGGTVGMFPVVPGQYSFRAELSLLERICDMNLHTEAMAIQRARNRARTLRAEGDHSLAQLFESVVIDEGRHVKIGRRWALFLTQNHWEKVMSILHMQKSRRHTGPPMLLQKSAARFLGLSDRYESSTVEKLLE